MAVASLATLVLGVAAVLHSRPGVARQIEIEGWLPPYSPTQDTARAEVWFAQPRILFDSSGRQWYRSPSGQQSLRIDPHSRFRFALGPTGKVSISLTLTTWLPPRRCTVRFFSDGIVTRYARNTPVAGWLGRLSVRLPEMPLPVRLDSEIESPP